MDNPIVPFSGRNPVGLPIGEHDGNQNDATTNTILNPISRNRSADNTGINMPDHSPSIS